jgi:TonB family protein
MILLLALAAAGLLPDGKTARFHHPAHRARSNLAIFFGDGDYPADARHRGEQGLVGFSVDIDVAGRVSACRITRSSGSAALDDATCRIARERIQFTPATDRQGRPVADQASSRVRWVLPQRDSSTSAYANLASYISDDDYPAEAIRAEEQGVVGFRLAIGPDGLVSDCSIELSSNSVSLDAATCRILQARARFRPARDSAGHATADSVKGRIRWVLPAEEPDSVEPTEVDLDSYISSADYPAEALRQRIEGNVGVELSVSPAGSVSQCRVTRPSGSALLNARTCEIVRARARFVPARDTAGQAVTDVVEGVVHWALPAP